MKFLILYTLFLASLTCHANAEFYKWVDENGVPHFSNTAPPRDVDVEVERRTESVGRPYEKQTVNDIQNQLDMSKTNEAKAKFYKGHADRTEELLKTLREDLEGESDNDKQNHQKKLRHQQTQIEQAEIKLYFYQKQYEKAKFGK